MNEKKLQEITEKIERALYLYSPIPITTIKEILDQLIAEVRELRKPLIVSSTIKKLADENKLYKDLYTNVNTQNMVYKRALEDIEQCNGIIDIYDAKKRAFIALEVDTNE